ncbi:MAG: hypothetical protein RL189_862 [Pseudomonadota bacterium]|jgi:hypothetical protein
MLRDKAFQLVDMAKQAVLKALSLTEEETKALLGKLPIEQISQKTTVEVEKIVNSLVSKLLDGTTEPVDAAVRAEVVKMIVELNTTPRNVVSNLRYLNELVQATAPRSLTDLKTLRTTLAERLIADAKDRLEKNSAAGAESGAAEVKVTEAAAAAKKSPKSGSAKHAE